MRSQKERVSNYVKMNDKTLHFLPFVPSWKRKRDFEIVRKWGDVVLTLTAPETMNVTELITLSQMLQDYQSNPSEWIDGGNIDGTQVLKRTLDLSKLVKAKGLMNKLPNRRTVYKSIYRWYQAELLYTSNTDNWERHTRYIYEMKTSDKKSLKDVTVLVNKDFLEFCIQNGLMFNWGRLLQYGNNAYAQLLDAYIQGTRKAIKGKKGNTYHYLSVYREERLFQAIGLNDTDLPLKRKREELKMAFETIHKIGELPKYLFDATHKQWQRADYIEYLDSK